MSTIHPEIEDLAFLLGEWQGSGIGNYPTIDNFEYLESVTFGHVGKPFVSYVQRTRTPDREAVTPLHAEAGYFRPTGAGTLELVIAQPSGIVEVHKGTVSAGQIHLEAIQVVTTPTAKEVNSVERTLEVSGDVLTYTVFMGAVGQPHQFHLRGELERV